MHGSTVFLVAFLTSVLTATGTVFLIEKTNLMGKVEAPVAEAIVPDLRGFTESDARNNVQASRLTLLVGSREASAEAKPGTVIRQSIPAGQRVPQQHPISVVISEELPKVPELKSLALAEATKRLEERGYKITTGAPVVDPAIPEGAVVTQIPAADAPLEKGKSVTVQLSSGSGEAPVPKVIGLTIANAKTELTKLGFEPNVRWVSMAETPTYVVLNQKPPANEKAKAGSKVEVVVNR
jgi:eukaryotic-like serine/threonine-protein kinase